MSQLSFDIQILDPYGHGHEGITGVDLKCLVDGVPHMGNSIRMPHAHAIALKGLVDMYNDRSHHLVLRENDWHVEHPYWCRVAGLSKCAFQAWLHECPEDDPLERNRMQELLDLHHKFGFPIRLSTSDERAPYDVRLDGPDG